MVTLRSDSTDMGHPRLPPPPHGRPPVASANSARTATMSRRGRARSPVAVNGRGPMEENPSSAAAAAAAAAKAYSTSRGGGSGGPAASGTSGTNGGRDERSVGGGSTNYGPPGPPPPHPGYDAAAAAAAGYPPHKWPHDPNKRSSRMHYPPRYGHPPHHRPPPPGYGGHPGYPPHPAGYGDRRYRGEHGPPPHARGGGPLPPHGSSQHPDPHGRRSYPVDYRYHNRGEGPTSPPKGSRGGTSLVLGGPTPIHVPKTAPPPAAAAPKDRPSRGSAASVFRGRPDGSVPPHPAAEDESSKILMSLRTPSTSFEEKKESDGTTSSLNLSPSDPPKILSATQQKRAVEMFEKSPDGTKSTTHIDTNASFTLFNQSFDSFGDNYFNVDSTLHAADSFGIVQTGSGSNPLPPADDIKSPMLLKGSLSKEILGPSGSGPLLLGYSPVNSFAVSPKESAGGSMMVLGGPDQRSNSPSQVLGMYRTYSGSRGPPPPRLEEPPYRGNYGYRGGPPPMGYDPYHGARPPPPQFPNPPAYEGPPGSMPPFYIFLRKCRGAFTSCSFLLPGLKAALLETPGDDYATPPGEFPSPFDIEVARRRVESSVCAFGGTHGESTSASAQSKKEKDEASSIFRDAEDKNSPGKESATVTPSSSVASPPRYYTRSKAKYEEQLAGRYYENESRLSWEFEENPPIEIHEDVTANRRGDNGDDEKDSGDNDDEFCQATGSDSKPPPSSPQSKLKYRCKLCGQPKQNHVCPYQQSLARNIGVMVYPAVNAFTADEPGHVAPPLTEMNNFVDIKDPSMVGSSDIPQSRPTPERSPRTTAASPKQVSPDSLQSSPGPSPPVPSSPLDEKEKRGTKRPHETMNAALPPPASAAAGPEEPQGDLLFVASMELKPQQFLSVSTKSAISSPEAYTYAALPLPYAQRKRLSDNLFSLSNEVPHLTDECAVVLREAREKDMWDLAVSELITQVLIVTRCSSDDHRFEGLAQYLLSLGISC